MNAGTGVTIRNPYPEDGEGIARVQIKAWQSAYAHIFPPDQLADLDADLDALAERWSDNIAPPKQKLIFLVATMPTGEVVGFAAAEKQPNQELPFETELQVIYLLPQYQRKGIGRALMREVATGLVQAGYTSMMLWVLKKNWDSRVFYEILGGQQVGESDYERWGDTYEIVAYGWKDLQQLL